MRDLPLNCLDGRFGHVPHRERQVEEEGLAGGLLPPHEVDRFVHQLIVDVGAHLRRERLDSLQWTAGRCLDNLRPRSRSTLGGAGVECVSSIVST